MRADELNVVEHGPDRLPVVVLVHGAPDRSGAFRVVLPHLCERRVVLYDRRGYGRSLEAAAPTSMRDHAEDLLAVLDRSPDPCVVVAHSFGSNPAMLAATLRPGAFAALGVWEPPMVWVDWWPTRTKDYDAAVASSPDPEGEVEAFYRQVLGDDTWDALDPEVRARRRAEGRAFQVDMASLASTPFDIADVTVPTVVGHGTETAPEHVRGARWLAEQLPDGRGFEVPGAGHFVNQTHPEAFARFVEATVALGQRT